MILIATGSPCRLFSFVSLFFFLSMCLHLYVEIMKLALTANELTCIWALSPLPGPLQCWLCVGSSVSRVPVVTEHCYSFVFTRSQCRVVGRRAPVAQFWRQHIRSYGEQRLSCESLDSHSLSNLNFLLGPPPHLPSQQNRRFIHRVTCRVESPRH